MSSEENSVSPSPSPAPEDSSANGASEPDSAILDNMKEFYGKKIQSKDDFESSACLLGGLGGRPYVTQTIKLVHEDIQNKYYGCGLVIPDNLDGASVLDLGSGAGLDCFVLSKLVGENGRVTGLDMTDEQIEVARNHIDYHTEKFGYKTPNVEFVQGYIEKLTEAGIKENTYDVVISNCVVNLSPDKSAVLGEALAALKEGGELYFSDMYADRAISAELKKDKNLWGEGFGGALVWEDLFNIAEKVGFSAPRLIKASTFDVKKQEFKDLLGEAKFCAATYRLFKLPETRQAACVATYNGNIEHCTDEFTLDHNLTFKTGEPVNVDSEVATILKTSRFANCFDFETPAKKLHKEEQATKENPFDFVQAAKCGAVKECSVEN